MRYNKEERHTQYTVISFFSRKNKKPSSGISASLHYSCVINEAENDIYMLITRAYTYIHLYSTTIMGQLISNSLRSLSYCLLFNKQSKRVRQDFCDFDDKQHRDRLSFTHQSTHTYHSGHQRSQLLICMYERANTSICSCV